MAFWRRYPSGEIPPPLSRNLISYLGWALSFSVATLIIVLTAANFLMFRGNPYSSLVTYLVLPGILAFGVGLILFGVYLEWRRRHKTAPGVYPPLPVIDVNQGWQRRRLAIGLVLITLFFGLSAIGTYQAYQFTESPSFCGQVCHQVMHPEFAAYHYSPHARVSCTACHIGSGAKWYVKTKLTGLGQVWAVLTHSYELPIQTPVANLRPARQTCEECHWPEKFSDSLEKVIWHFASDQVNTAYRYNLLLKVGGGSPELGLGRGIHWHISSGVAIRYWARDRQRLDIPWVEVTMGQTPPRVYRSADCPDPLPQDAEIRTMDCIDCHNRPSHIYRSSLQLIDDSMAHAVLNVSLPYLKRNAAEVLAESYPNTPAALKAIADTLGAKYRNVQQGPRGRELVDQNIAMLQTLYQRNFFPDQKVDWRQYPNHIGHYEFPGCYRCHNDRHQSADGHKISNDCELCHEFVDQAEGVAAYGPVAYRKGEYRHPLNMPDIWRGHNCTDCHGPSATTPAVAAKPEQAALAVGKSSP